MRRSALYLVLLAFVLVPLALAEEAPEDATAVCSFADDKQFSVHYTRAVMSKGKEDVPSGRVWAPNDTPMGLFLETPLVLNDVTIPTGGYTMYLMGGKDTWTVIVSKNVTLGSKYDQTQDLARASMQTAKLPQPQKEFDIYFGKNGPKSCEMRVLC